MKGRLEMIYQTRSGIETRLHSDMVQAGELMMIVEDMERTGRIKKIRIIDNNENNWTLKELKKYTAKIQTEPHQVMVYFDGGYDRESKRAGLGCVIYFEQNNQSYRIRKNALVQELASNNEAEYAALHLGIKELENLGVQHMTVKFIGDSMVVVHQLNEEWACYEPELVAWIDRIENKLKQMGVVPEYELISRKKNEEADQLASQALKEIPITSKLKLS